MSIRANAGLVAALTLLTALLMLVPVEAWAEKRVALVVGNAAYGTSPLRNPVNDARAMAVALRGQGFKVIPVENGDKPAMERAVAQFGTDLERDGVGLLYYSGHGIQVDGRNYLIPVDAQLASRQRVRLETIDIDLILEQMQAAGTRVNLVILDACRNNPFEQQFRGAGAGLAQMNAPQGTLIAYATSPGRVASDGEGENGLYTSALLKTLPEPGLKIEDLFKRVRSFVSERSHGDQVPWESSSLTGDFYFQSAPAAPAPGPAVAPLAPPVVVAGIDPMAVELTFWQSIQNSTSPADFQAYLDAYPNGRFAALARSRLQAAAPRPAPVAAPAPAASQAAPAARAAIDSQPQPGGNDPTGAYTIAGDSDADKTPYTGTVQVIRTGETYQITWTIDKEIETGIGLLDGNLLAVGSGDSEGLEVAAYRRDGEGGWNGVWSETGQQFLNHESWRPGLGAGHDGASGASPANRSGKAAMRGVKRLPPDAPASPAPQAVTTPPAQTAPAMDGPDPSGSYTVSGKDTSDNSPYTGTLQVSRTGQTYRLVWKIDGETYRGIGLMQDGALVIASLNGDGGADVMVTRPNGSGGWSGRWTSVKDTNISTEDWKPGR